MHDERIRPAMRERIAQATDDAIQELRNMAIGSRYAPPAPAAVVYQGRSRDGTEGILVVPGGLPATELVAEDEFGFYSRREQLQDGRWVMGWWSGADGGEPLAGAPGPGDQVRAVAVCTNSGYQ